MGHRTLVSLGNDATDKLARRGSTTCTLHLAHAVCPILSLVSTLVFSRTGGVLSRLNFLTHRLPRFPPRNLCFLVTLAVFFLNYAGTNTAFCYVLICLGLAESSILPAAPADTRPRTPLNSLGTVQLPTFCAVHSLATLSLSTTSGPGSRKFFGFWGSMVFCHAPIPRKGSGNQQQQQGCSSKWMPMMRCLVLQKLGWMKMGKFFQ